MNMKYSIMGQIISVILTHLEAVFVFFAVWVIAISVTSSKIGGTIYSAIATVFYVSAMYSVCYAKAKDDKKSYSPLTPEKYKGILLSAGLLVINIAVAFIYSFIWKTASDGANLTGIGAVAVNVFCLFWFSPFISFLGEQNGVISVLGYVAIFALPVLSCFFGYLAGYKNFDISRKLKFLVYEKKK